MMIEYTYHCPENAVGKPALDWVMEVFGQYSCTTWKERDAANSIIVFGETHVLNVEFWTKIEQCDFNGLSDFLNQEMLIESTNGNVDFFATAFFFLNCIWERDERFPRDDWGRSEFSGSIWKEFGLDRPRLIVNQVFNCIAESVNLEISPRASQAFLSHDIDVVFGAWKEDGKAALKQKKLLGFFKIQWRHLTHKPDWLNFRTIVQIEKKFGRSSTFFWIPTKEPVKGVGKNADYDINGPRLKKELDWISENGSSHGVHKSIGRLTLKQNLDMLNLKVISCRYHYLKFQFSDLIEEMNGSGLNVDASLGYAEVFGYRNGYSLPFKPFDFKRKKASNFVEVPLTIMDGTFRKYLALDKEQALKSILTFIEEHKSNAVISILWHNSNFTNYKYHGFPELYSAILASLNDLKLSDTSPELVYEEFK